MKRIRVKDTGKRQIQVKNQFLKLENVQIKTVQKICYRKNNNNKKEQLEGNVFGLRMH